MLDVKKLITGFLILALGASASAWILSYSTNPFQGASSDSGVSSSSSATVPSNAFATNNSEPDDIAALLAGELPSSTEVALNDPNNLTAAMGNSLLDGLVSANPDGIQTDSDGNGQVAEPDNQAILAELSENPAAQDVAIPDWDTEVAKDNASIKISSKPSSQDIINYLNSFNEINDKYFLQTGLAQTAATSPSPDVPDAVLNPSTIIGASPEISEALSDALQMNIPAPFATFQKSWIKLLVYEKNTALLFNSISTDPARSVLALNVEENHYNNAVNNFNAAREGVLGENIVSMGASPSEQNHIAELIDSIFSIKSANAQVGTAACATAAGAAGAAGAGGAAGGAGAGGGASAAASLITVPVSDAVGTAAIVAAVTANTAAHTAAITASCSAVNEMSWGTYLLKLAENIGLQVLKNTLIAQLQSHIVKWIQGSGAPLFVQNWADDLANAGIMSATNWINGNFSCIGTSQMPRIQIVLNALYKPGNNACAAQFASQLSSANLTNFMKNFENGGFVSFGQTLLPSNNFYGGLIFTAQNAQQASQQAKSLFSIKTTSQQGMKGGEVCGDGSNPNGTYYECYGAGDNADWKSSNAGDQAKCQSQGGEWDQNSNNGQCTNGSTPTTQAPALLTGQALGSGVSIGGHQILSATDVGGLVAAFANSLISAVTSQIVKAASGAINGAINGSGGTSLMSINPDSLLSPTSTTNSALVCSPTNATAAPGAPALFTASGGFDSNGNIPTYYWYSSDGQSVSGPMFSPSYTAAGNYTITLGDSNGDASTTCYVAQASSTPVSCSPNTQTLTFATSTGQTSVTVSAQNGAVGTSSAPSYAWTAPGAISTTISYPGFQATYNTTGTFNISVIDSADNSSSTCQVILQ
jgi:hypothetical protein